MLKDEALPEATRIEVIERLEGGVSRDDAYIEALLAIVQGAGEPAGLRSAALKALAGAAFEVVRFRPHRQAYERALHDLVADPDATLREAAVDTLAVLHDPEIQQVLLAGLRGDGPLPVERARAIQLLGEDDHLDNLPWLRELFDGGSDAERQEAVRLMGSYAEASETLEDVLRDKDEAPEVRQQSMASLRNVAPDRFEAAAKEIATDSSEDPDVRTACLTTLQHLGDADRVYGDADFIRRVEEVGGDESAPQVAAQARDLVEQRPAR